MSIILIQFLVSILSLHPYYVSVFEVEHNPETQTFQVAARIFISDLEEVLMEEGKDSPKIGTEEENPEANTWIADYLTQHFTLAADGTSVKLTMIGKETDNDVVWCYLESEAMEDFKTLDIYADLLIEQFPTQTNIVHMKVWGAKASTILRKGRTDKQLLYEDLH